MNTIHLLINISSAIFCGLLVGFERQISYKPIGIHTTTLVSFGSCLFLIVSQGLNEVNSPSRIAAQVVSGIGFIGGGVIIKEGNKIKGINSAATIWTSAALGCLCSSGLWHIGMISSVLITVLNYFLCEKRLKWVTKYFIKTDEENVKENLNNV